jgi:hypothetical protein
MSSPITQSAVAGILKELYDDQKVQWLVFSDNPWLTMIKKSTRFGGKYFPQPVVYGTSQGASASFSSAYANQSSPLVAEFLVTRVSDFSIATIDGQLLACAQSNPSAFIDGSELMIDAAFRTATNRLASAMFRNGAGTIAQMSGAPVSVSGTTYTITLSNADDQVQFEVGQTLNCTQLVDGSAGVSNAQHATVTKVDRSNGILTVTIPTATTGWTSGYYLAVDGDLPTTTNNNYQPSTNTTTNSLLKCAGLAAWLPLAGPTSGESFFGVDRTVDSTRLAGVVGDYSSLSLEEAALKASGKVAMNGGRVDTAIVSFATYEAFVTSVGSKVQYIDYKLGEIGFRGIQINGANSVISLFPDRNCPDGVLYLLESSSWELKSEGEMPHILKYMDEIEILRVPGADSAELRVGGYFNQICKAPGHNGAFTIATQTF